jgi:hypothetical protein
MVFSLEHDIKVTKNHQNLLPTQSVLVAHTVVLAVLNLKNKNTRTFTVLVHTTTHSAKFKTEIQKVPKN